MALKSNILMDDFVAKNFQDTSNNTKSFNVAYIFQVIEYVANPYSFIQSQISILIQIVGQQYLVQNIAEFVDSANLTKQDSMTSIQRQFCIECFCKIFHKLPKLLKFIAYFAFLILFYCRNVKRTNRDFNHYNANLP